MGPEDQLKPEAFLQTIEEFDLKMIEILDFKQLEPDILLKIIKLQAKRISELEADFEVLDNMLYDLIEYIEKFEVRYKHVEN